ncbi:hypothetical protein [Pedobacter sp. CAN_A7]|uniref:hypothetical protein n=1 Tax=Pedobacter sp. CAN_A7 TaxID=2787722 RepID=UPI0018CBE21E
MPILHPFQMKHFYKMNMSIANTPIPVFQVPAVIGSFDLFPLEISSRTDVVYHGTSLAYSEGIETNGFSVGHLPVDRAKVELLVESLGILGEISNHNANCFLQASLNAPGRLDHYLQKITTNSFSPLSYTAARYASLPLVGGQIIQFIAETALEVKNKLEAMGNASDDAHIENCSSIILECEGYRQAPGVVYAVSITPELAACFKSNLLFVLLSQVDIPREHIVGKMIIPSDFVLPAVSEKEKVKLGQKVIRDSGVANDIYEQGGEAPDDYN